MAVGGKITRNSVASAVVAATLLFALLVWRRDAAPRLERTTGALSPPVGMFNPVRGAVTPSGESRGVSPSVRPAFVPPPAPVPQVVEQRTMVGAPIEPGVFATDAGPP